MKTIDCIICRLGFAYKISGYRKEIKGLELENKVLRDQIERYHDIMRTEDNLDWYNEDVPPDLLNDIFPDKE